MSACDISKGIQISVHSNSFGPAASDRRTTGDSDSSESPGITTQDLLGEVEKHFGHDIAKYDLREAAYLAAMKNPDAVIDQLHSMGCAESGSDGR